MLARGEAGEDLAVIATQAEAMVRAVDSHGALLGEIAKAYPRLGDEDEVPVAVRSSATAEDSEPASFAGQQETYLHVRGVGDVVERIRHCWCSFFTERALFYRSKKGSLRDLGMAVVVQRMVEPDVAGQADEAPSSALRDRPRPGRWRPRAGADARGGRGPDALGEQLARLTKVGIELEERLGGPQDIEWAIHGDELFVLQSRPSDLRTAASATARV